MHDHHYPDWNRQDRSTIVSREANADGTPDFTLVRFGTEAEGFWTITSPHIVATENGVEYPTGMGKFARSAEARAALPSVLRGMIGAAEVPELEPMDLRGLLTTSQHTEIEAALAQVKTGLTTLLTIDPNFDADPEAIAARVEEWATNTTAAILG